MSVETLGLRRALFLDRDGVINQDKQYLVKVEDVVFVDGIFELMKEAQRLGFVILVVTNQSGVARGYFSEDEVRILHRWMAQEFEGAGVPIAGFYYSPFHPDGSVEAYRRSSDCRKPGPGMLKRAAAEHLIDLERSMLVGDKVGDLMAARAAGLARAYWLSPPDGEGEVDLGDCELVRAQSLRAVRSDLVRSCSI